MSQGPYNPYPQQPQWGPQQPSPGGPQWGPQPPMQPQKSGGGAGKAIALGCVGVMALCCIGGAAAFMIVGKRLGGTEVASTNTTPGQPFLLSIPANSGGATRRVWIDYEATFSQGLGLQGMLTVTTGGTASGQYQMNFTRNGQCENPIVGQSSSSCINTSYSSVNGQGSARGRYWLFDLPTGSAASTVTGNVFAGPGVTVSRLRFYATE